MNARLYQNVMFFTLLFLVLFVSSSFGQESLSPNLQLLQAQIDQKKELVAGWEFSATITFFLAVLVVFLGRWWHWCRNLKEGNGVLLSS